MSFRSLTRAVLVLFAVLRMEAHAVEVVPVVYQDEYLTIRAGVPELGQRPIHLGDAIAMVMQLEFDPGEVRVQALDGDYFRRGFHGQKGISLYAPPRLSRESTADDRVEMRAVWTFQLLDCPAELSTCAGINNYELPVLSFSYQLIDESGRELNSKQARFRPWPGRITAAPALAVRNASPDELATYFPGGAYPALSGIDQRQNAGLVSVVAGIVLLVLGFGNRSRGRRRGGYVTHARHADSRWEDVLHRLRNDALQDDEWADMLRRCLSWYCVDEIGQNPFAWLHSDARFAPDAPGPVSDLQAFFLDVLGRERITRDERSAYLEEFARIAEARSGARTAEDTP